MFLKPVRFTSAFHQIKSGVTICNILCLYLRKLLLLKFIKHIDEAIEFFKLNIKLHPNSFNVYDSMGEAYMINGQKSLAIENCEKSIAINPQNENGKEMLKKLKSE